VDLAALESRWESVAASETLLHGHLRADKMLLTSDRVYFVDWPSAASGAAWCDLLFLDRYGLATLSCLAAGRTNTLIGSVRPRISRVRRSRSSVVMSAASAAAALTITSPVIAADASRAVMLTTSPSAVKSSTVVPGPVAPTNASPVWTAVPMELGKCEAPWNMCNMKWGDCEMGCEINNGVMTQRAGKGYVRCRRVCNRGSPSEGSALSKFSSATELDRAPGVPRIFRPG
jgi:hypothetical protein